MARGNQPCQRHVITGPEDRRNDPTKGCRQCAREAQARYRKRMQASYRIVKQMQQLGDLAV